MKGIKFYDLSHTAPSFSHGGPCIYGQSKQGQRAVAAFMYDYYSVSAEEQRRMVENTIALCEMKYAEQEVNNV